MKRSILLFLLSLSLSAPLTFAQNPQPQETPPIVGEVTVTSKTANSNPDYREVKSGFAAANSFSGDCAVVNNLVLKKDRTTFTFTSGEIYFLAPVKGRNVGAVFIGEGEISLTPPTEIEKKSLAIFTDTPELKEQFGQMVMVFTDKTFEEVKNSPGVRMITNGANATRARDAFKEKETLLKKTFRYNISARILTDIFSPERPGFFYSFIDGRKFGKLAFQLDPLGLPEVYPEQVELSSYGDNTAGIWTAFHLEGEYAKGNANSWADRRLYDITHHNLDTTIQGTRMIVKDVITLQTRVPNVRYLPFDLYRSLRVKSVRSEDNSEMDYIQEAKDEDADFGVILPKAMEAGKPFKLTVEYDGIEALQLAGKGNYTLLPRSTWYPNNPFTAFGDRANFEMTFRYPKKFMLIAVGNRIGAEQTEGELKISKWSSEGTELAVSGFNYGDFKGENLIDSETGYQLEVFTNKELPDDIKRAQMMIREAEAQGVGAFEGNVGNLNTAGGAKLVLTEAQNATRIYNTFFGKLPYKRVAMSQQPLPDGQIFGQAWPTLIFMPYYAFFDTTQRKDIFGAQMGTAGFWREVAAHEVAHQWWGHTMGWTSYHDQWMSEGFAEFSTSLYVFYVQKDINKFTDFWENQRKQIVEATPGTKGKRPFTVGPVTQGYRLSSAKTGSSYQMVYPKGAYILHMIRMMMYDHKGTGDDRFRAMMGDFIKTNYNKDISTEDFKRAVEKYITKEMDINGDKKMDWFFDSWVYGSDVPDFKLNYQIGSANGKPTLTARITQSGVSKDFVSLVPLYVDYGKGWKFLGKITLIGNSALDITNVPLPEAPKKVALDAYKDILNTRIDVNK